jgi:hypothetical protein
MENHEGWTQPNTVATNLRKSNKLRKKLEKEAFTLKAKEKEENTVRNIRSAGDHSSHEAKVFQFRQNKRQCREDNVWGDHAHNQSLTIPRLPIPTRRGSTMEGRA